MIFKEDFLVAIKLETLRVIAVYLLENKCRMNYINIIIYIPYNIYMVCVHMICTIWNEAYDMGHMGHDSYGTNCWCLSRINWVIFDMVRLAKMQNTHLESQVWNQNTLSMKLKNQAERLTFVPFGCPSRWFFGCILSVYSYDEPHNIKLMVNWRILKAPLATKFYSQHWKTTFMVQLNQLNFLH